MTSMSVKFGPKAPDRPSTTPHPPPQYDNRIEFLNNRIEFLNETVIYEIGDSRCWVTRF